MQQRIEVLDSFIAGSCREVFLTDLEENGTATCELNKRSLTRGRAGICSQPNKAREKPKQ